MFETENFTIRETSESDLKEVIRMENASDTEQFIAPYSAEEHMQIANHPEALHLLAVRKENDVPVGFFIINLVDRKHHSMEVRRLVIDDKGKGSGQEMINWVLSWCFDELNFRRIWFDVFCDNKRAIRLYNYYGFVKEGVLRDSFFDGEKYRSIQIMSMLHSEYKELLGEAVST